MVDKLPPTAGELTVLLTHSLGLGASLEAAGKIVAREWGPPFSYVGHEVNPGGEVMYLFSNPDLVASVNLDCFETHKILHVDRRCGREQ